MELRFLFKNIILQVGLILICNCGTLSADDWPQWRGPERDGVWRESGTITEFSSNKMKPDWSTPVGAGYSGPTVIGDRVYLTSYLEEPEQVEQVHCVDRLTGKEIWKYAYPCEYMKIGYPLGPRAAVAISEGRAYALGTMGNLHCLDATTGKVLWKKDFVADYGVNIQVWGVAASPLVDEARVYLQVGGEPDAAVVAFDKNTGKEVWRALDGRASYSAPKFIEQGGRKLLLVWTGDWFATLEPKTGAVVWKDVFKPAKMVINVGDAVVDKATGRIFFSSFYDGSYLYEMNHDTMKLDLLWSRRGRSEMNTDALHSIIMTPVIRGNYVYGLDSHGEFRCLDMETGDRVWSEETIVEKGRWGTAFFVQQGELTWIFTEKGELIIGMLSPEGFERISSTQLIEPTTFLPRRNGNILWSHPAYAHKHIFVRNDRELISVDLSK
jgi:outer membrane protein assembly factor BamB